MTRVLVIPGIKLSFNLQCYSIGDISCYLQKLTSLVKPMLAFALAFMFIFITIISEYHSVY